MKTTLFTLCALLASTSVYADWSADVLCVQPRPTEAGHSLLADAQGRLVVKTGPQGEATGTFEMSSVRLFENYGQVRGSVVQNVTLSGEMLDGNDELFSTATPNTRSPLIHSIVFDLSSIDAGLTKITTQKGNVYETRCVIRED